MSRSSRTPRSSHSTRRLRGDDGVSAIGLLSVIVILGILVTIPLAMNIGSKGKSTTTVRGATTTTAPKTIAGGANEAAIAACQGDFESILQAVETYRALNGSNPPPGVAWASSGTHSGPYLQNWPSIASRWTFTWNGSTLSVVPVHGVAAHGSYGVRATKTGCYAVATT